MLRIASFVLVAALGVGFVGGCGSQPGKTTMTYARMSKELPPMTKASSTGTYAVYPSDGTTPIWSGELSSGDEYGFTKDGDKVSAVVKMATGEMKNIPLDKWFATSYYWKYQGDMKKM